MVARDRWGRTTALMALLAIFTVPRWTLAGSSFIRGDADSNGQFHGLYDALFLLNFQFRAGAAPPCLDAADADDDGEVHALVDATHILASSFLPGLPRISPPHPECGVDGTPDTLGCPGPVAHCPEAFTRCRFEKNIGAGLGQSDDDFDLIMFTQGFTFPFFGSEMAGIWVNANGNLTFGRGDFEFNPQPLPGYVVNGLPRISLAFVDFNPATSGADVFVESFPDRLIVTWNNLPLFPFQGCNTFQAVLHSDGAIEFVYHGLTADGSQLGFGNTPLDISVAISPGGTPEVLTVDFSRDTPFSSRAQQAVFENFDALHRFDLDFSCISWHPNAAGGFDVTVNP